MRRGSTLVPADSLRRQATQFSSTAPWPITTGELRFGTMLLSAGPAVAAPALRISRGQIRTVLNLSELVTTETEERLIAAAAKIGEIRMPRKG